MPKKKTTLSINLLPKTEGSFPEKFLTFSLTFGRYIIIGTEIIVLLAFLSRFKLDRDLIDLNDKVKEKGRILRSLSQTEKKVDSLQFRLEQIKKATSQQASGIRGLSVLGSLTPVDIHVSTIDVQAEKITIIGTAKNVEVVSQYVSTLRSESQFKKDSVVLESIEQPKDNTQLKFTISAQVSKETT